MNKTTTELTPGFRRSKMSSMKGQRVRHVVTMNPNKANPGEKLYIDVPKLNDDSCLVPGSFHLLFEFVNKNTKSWFLNDLSRLLTKELTITLAGEKVFESVKESDIGVYRDLWKSEKDRGDAVEYGVASENLRKLISKDDSGVTSGDVGKVEDALIFSVFGSKLKIPLGKIMEDQGLYAPSRMNNNMKYEITLPKGDEIMVAQGGSTVAGYTLENLELEYETIESLDLANDITSLYTSGVSLPYEHVTKMKTVSWDKDATILNENINIPRKSMKAVVFLFTTGVKTDSEKLFYPNIDKVKLTIEGVPNSVYSQGIPKSRFYSEAMRVFGCGGENSNMTLASFFIDLRSVEDKLTHGAGKKIVNTQSGILIEITKRATTANVNCEVFVLSDGLVNFVGGTLQSVHY